MVTYEKKGYLDHDFRIFHLTDTLERTFSYHYHDFDKVILFIRGNVSYSIEGKKYDLKPYDIVLVKAGEIHRPVIYGNETYERIIIYISSSFMKDYSGDDFELDYCFRQAGEKHSNVLRIEQLPKSRLYAVCRELENSFGSREYANSLYQKVLFLEFMIWLNRAVLNEHVNYLDTTVSNEKVVRLIEYITEHLNEDISVDSLSSAFFLSRSYLMHLFKEETGYSIGTYINEKRLLSAKAKIQEGLSVTEACYNSGFKDYTTFSRAFKKMFGVTPRHADRLS